MSNNKNVIPPLPMTASGLPDALAAANSYTDFMATTRDTVRVANEVAQLRSKDAPIRALASDIVGNIDKASRDIPYRVAVWIRDNVKYTQETPSVEILQGPYRTLGGKISVVTPMGPFKFNGTGTGDCDDLSILFATLCRSLGIEAYLVGIAKSSQPDSFFHAMGYCNGNFYELSKDSTYGGLGGARVESTNPYPNISCLIYDPVRRAFKWITPGKTTMKGMHDCGCGAMNGPNCSCSMGETAPAAPAAPAAPKHLSERPLNSQSFCGEPLDSLQPRYTVPFNLYAPSRQISGISMNGMGCDEGYGAMGAGEGISTRLLCASNAPASSQRAATSKSIDGSSGHFGRLDGMGTVIVEPTYSIAPASLSLYAFDEGVFSLYKNDRERKGDPSLKMTITPDLVGKEVVIIPPTDAKAFAQSVAPGSEFTLYWVPNGKSGSSVTGPMDQLGQGGTFYFFCSVYPEGGVDFGLYVESLRSSQQTAQYARTGYINGRYIGLPKPVSYTQPVKRATYKQPVGYKQPAYRPTAYRPPVYQPKPPPVSRFEKVGQIPGMQYPVVALDSNGRLLVNVTGLYKAYDAALTLGKVPPALVSTLAPSSAGQYWVYFDSIRMYGKNKDIKVSAESGTAISYDPALEGKLAELPVKESAWQTDALTNFKVDFATYAELASGLRPPDAGWAGYKNTTLAYLLTAAAYNGLAEITKAAAVAYTPPSVPPVVTEQPPVVTEQPPVTEKKEKKGAGGLVALAAAAAGVYFLTRS